MLAQRLRQLCERAPQVYRMMVRQELPAEVQGVLASIADEPELVDGFDIRRLRVLPNLDLVWHHVDLELIREFIDQLERRSTEERRRTYQLLLVTAMEQQISPIAAWYLERAARLLLYGLEIECIAMCRAVLESALRYRIPDAELEREGVKRLGKDFDLAGRIIGAKRLRYFDRAMADRATKIRKTGNDVLHPSDPEKFDHITSRPEATQRVADLARLLRCLYPLE